MRKIFFLLVFSSFILGCEEVIEVELATTETRLVVNGVIRVDVEQPYLPIEIKVSETTNFFESNRPTSLDDNALIFYGQPNPEAPEILENLASSSLAETAPGSGIYVPDPTFDNDQRILTQNITPNTVFILVLEHKGRRYAARTTYTTAVPLVSIAQGEDTLFDEEDVEIKVTIQDELETSNFFVFDFGQGEFLALDDQFIDGQEFEFSYFPQRKLDNGQLLTVSILGADQQFYNYMDLLIEQTQNDGGIFETPAATVRGNVFDVTDLDNILVFDNVKQPEAFPLGFFAVVQELKDSITIQ